VKALEPTLGYARWLPEAGRPITSLATRELELIAKARESLDQLASFRERAERKIRQDNLWTEAEIAEAKEPSDE